MIPTLPLLVVLAVPLYLQIAMALWLVPFDLGRPQ